MPPAMPLRRTPATPGNGPLLRSFWTTVRRSSLFCPYPSVTAAEPMASKSTNVASATPSARNHRSVNSQPNGCPDPIGQKLSRMAELR